MEPSKVVYVHFKEPYEGMTDLYYPQRSVAAYVE